MVTIVSSSANSQNDLLDQKIAKSKQLFFQELQRKKRNIKRKWLDINAITYEHCLQILPYRSMLQHVQEITAERRAKMLESSAASSSLENSESHSLDQNTAAEAADDTRVRINLIDHDSFVVPIDEDNDEDGDEEEGKSQCSNAETQSDEDDDEYIFLPTFQPKSKISDPYEDPVMNITKIKKDTLGLQIP